MHPFISSHAPRWRAGLLILGLPVALPAGELIWSPSGGGTGGSGIWSPSEATWWDGTQQVPWTTGTAIFGGTGGTVTVNDFVMADRLVFTTPGYILDRWGQGIWGNFGKSLVIETQADATIGCALWAMFSDRSLTKTGAGTLTLSGFPGFFLLDVSKMIVEAGTLRVEPYDALHNSAVSIAAGAKLALAPDSSSTVRVNALSGEGRVEAEGTGDEIVLGVGDGYSWWAASRTFAGVLADGDHRKLGVRFSGEEHTLTGVNTYTGGTEVAGRLTLTGNGALAGSSEITIGRGGVLALGTTGAAGQRLLDTATVTLSHGELMTTGGVAGVVERFGTLTFGSGGLVRLDGGGFEVAALSRVQAGDLQFWGTGEVWLPEQPLVAGVLAPHITWADGWATQDAAGLVTPWTHYTSDLATAGAQDHVRLTSNSPVVLPSGGALTVGSLLVKANIRTLDLGGRTLTLAQGGMLFRGTEPLHVRGGTLTSGLAASNAAADNELMVHVRGFSPSVGSVEISAEIAEQTPGLTVTKLGEGVLSLTGNNTFTGQLRIADGTVRVGSDAALGRGDTLWLGDGTLEVTASFVSTKGLSLAPSSRTTRIGTRGSVFVSGGPESPKITTPWDVTFLGETTGSLIKGGTGTLRLGRVTGDFAELVNRRGTLVVDDVRARRLTVELGGESSSGGSSSTQLGGDSFESVDLGVWGGSHELDLGGLTTGDLRIASLALAANAELTLRFDLGAVTQDHWRIGTLWSAGGGGRLLFDFRGGSGLVTGRDYTLWTLDAGVLADQRLVFGLAPELVAEGWAASFLATGSELRVNLSAIPVPEPATWGMLVGAAALAAAGLRRRVPRR